MRPEHRTINGTDGLPVVCHECEAQLHEAEPIIQYNGYWYHDGCFIEEFAQCDYCGEFFHNGDISLVLDGRQNEAYACCECLKNGTVAAKNAEEAAYAEEGEPEDHE